MDKKLGKPCARCSMSWAAHKAGTVGACSSYRGKWKPPKKKPVPGSLERALNAMDEEK